MSFSVGVLGTRELPHGQLRLLPLLLFETTLAMFGVDFPHTAPIVGWKKIECIQNGDIVGFPVVLGSARPSLQDSNSEDHTELFWGRLSDGQVSDPKKQVFT